MRILRRSIAWIIIMLTIFYNWLNRKITPNPYSLDDRVQHRTVVINTWFESKNPKSNGGT